LKCILVTIALMQKKKNFHHIIFGRVVVLPWKPRRTKK